MDQKLEKIFIDFANCNKSKADMLGALKRIHPSFVVAMLTHYAMSKDSKISLAAYNLLEHFIANYYINN